MMIHPDQASHSPLKKTFNIVFEFVEVFDFQFLKVLGNPRFEAIEQTTESGAQVSLLI
jgi:hypothetical protein